MHFFSSKLRTVDSGLIKFVLIIPRASTYLFSDSTSSLMEYSLLSTGRQDKVEVGAFEQEDLH